MREKIQLPAGGLEGPARLLSGERMPLRIFIGRALRSAPFLIHRLSRLFGRPPQRGTSPSPETLEGVRKILVIQLDAIGDFLMATPALRALRRRFPNARLHILVPPGVASLARTLPWLESVETLPRNFLLSGRGRMAGALQWASKLVRMRRMKFDLIVDLTGLFASAFAAWTVHARLRLGLRLRRPLGFFQTEGFGHFYTHEFDADESGHTADRMGLLAAALGGKTDAEGWRIGRTRAMKEGAEEVLRRTGIGADDGPLIIVHPGAKWPPRRWPEAAFAETIDILEDRGNRVIVIGGPGEGDVLEKTGRHCRSSPAILWPPEPLETILGLLERADAFLGNDSGPMHMAAAMGTPVVAIFGPNAPGRVGPRGSPLLSLYSALECSPCQQYFARDHCHRGHNYCLDGFRPPEVAAAVELSRQRNRIRRRAIGPPC